MIPLFPRDLAVASLLVSAPLARCAATADWQTWGPYRPGLYFGVRPQIPDSLLMGLMWTGGDEKDTFLNSRPPLFPRQALSAYSQPPQTSETRASRMMV